MVIDITPHLIARRLWLTPELPAKLDVGERRRSVDSCEGCGAAGGELVFMSNGGTIA